MTTLNVSSLSLSHLTSLSSSLPKPHPYSFLSFSTTRIPPLPPLLSLTMTTNNTRQSKPRRLLAAVLALKSLLEADPISIATVDDAEAGIPPAAGVYAVYDGDNQLQFIGISRSVATSVAAHRKSLRHLCVSVKVGVVDEPNREALTEAWKSWMETHIAGTGKVPPGNEKGNTTWVRPPPKTKADLRLTPGRHVELTVPLEQLIDKLVKENKVVAFIKGSRSAPSCGFSQRVIAILETQGVDYESIDVLDDEYNNGLRETLKKYSNWPTFPQVFVNGELVGGCDILTSKYEKGELSSLLKG